MDCSERFDNLAGGLHVEFILLAMYTAVLKLVNGIADSNREVTRCTRGQLLAGWLALLFAFVIALYRHMLGGYVRGDLQWRLLRLVLYSAVLSCTHYRPISCLVSNSYLSYFSFIQGAVNGLIALVALVFLARRVRWSEFCSNGIVLDGRVAPGLASEAEAPGEQTPPVDNEVRRFWQTAHEQAKHGQGELLGRPRPTRTRGIESWQENEYWPSANRSMTLSSVT